MFDEKRNSVEPRSLRATDVRQGEIILRTRRRRIIFIAGLIGFIVLAFLGSLLGYR